MAISPIAIATHGLLNSPLSVAAVRGHLTIDDDDVVSPARGGGSPILLPYAKLQRQLKREDEEILAIIIAATELLD
jgi:hypothetical protein